MLPRRGGDSPFYHRHVAGAGAGLESRGGYVVHVEMNSPTEMEGSSLELWKARGRKGDDRRRS